MNARTLGNVAVVIVLAWLTYIVLTTKQLWLLDNANLMFHEAGHAVLFWAPQFLSVLGGTLMQVLVPVVCLLYFARQKAFVSSMVALWWLGQNFINISVYIGDATARVLPLLGGQGGHDWAYLLGKMQLITYDTTIASVVFFLGAALMCVALIEVIFHIVSIRQHRFHQ